MNFFIEDVLWWWWWTFTSLITKSRLIYQMNFSISQTEQIVFDSDFRVNNSEQMCRLSVKMPSRLLLLSLIFQLLCCSLLLPHPQMINIFNCRFHGKQSSSLNWRLSLKAWGWNRNEASSDGSIVDDILHFSSHRDLCLIACTSTFYCCHQLLKNQLASFRHPRLKIIVIATISSELRHTREEVCKWYTNSF